VAKGSGAFTTLADILDELVQIGVMNQQQSKDAASLLLQCKQYLRTDFKARIVCSLL
jgi:polyhydroxyalkanoate synthesis regulator phasin